MRISVISIAFNPCDENLLVIVQPVVILFVLKPRRMRDTEHTCVAEPYGTTTALPVHIPLPRCFFYVRYGVRSRLQQFRDSDPYREPYSYASFSLIPSLIPCSYRHCVR